jgi:glyoxylase-like metal-dependent hydrolase (beta-lactamase superfamily II)
MIDQDHKLDIFSRLDLLRTAVYGDAVRILPDTFLLKFPGRNGNMGNGYAIRHHNGKDLVLIDTISKEHKLELARFRESEYNINAILLTNGNLIDQAYTELSEIAAENDTQIFVHPLDSKQSQAVDITGYHDVYTHFDLSVFHTPGFTGGAIVVHCGLNGALFTGDSAVGSDYSTDEYIFRRPGIDNEQNNLALRESWRSISVDFDHMLPLQGKPQFDLTEQQRKHILNQLISI